MEMKMENNRIISHEELIRTINTLCIQLDEERRQHQEDVRRLEEQLSIALDEIARLKSIINNNSNNSSRPPSSDQVGKKKREKSANEYNSRHGKSKKRNVGGQICHKGKTLTKKDVEEKIASGKCRHEIENIGYVAGGKYVSKYVIDVKIETVIREIRIYADAHGKYHIPKAYYSDVTYGTKVKALAAMLYSEGVMSNDRIASFLNMGTEGTMDLSESGVYGFCSQFGALSAEQAVLIEKHMMKAPVVCTDATTVRVDGKQSYVRNFSTEDSVVYYPLQSKSIETLQAVDFAQKFEGVLEHDHETALYHFGTGHGECNVHIMRYLRKNTEECSNPWSEDMISLLAEMNRVRKERIEQGETRFAPQEILSFEKRYYTLIEEGRKQNKTTKYASAREKELALLNRLEKYGDNHLLFLHRFDVPFDNNMSERDLRKVKNRQKMSGGFRKISGQQMYCSIMSVVETAKRRGMCILDTIEQILSGSSVVFQPV